MRAHLGPAVALFLLVGCASGSITPREQQRLAGKTFVIVGASSGFGRGVAEELGRARANVVVAARRTDLLEEIAAGIRTSGGNAVAVTADAANPADIARVAEAARSRFGSVDVWINMVGVGAIGRFWDIPIEDHSRLVDVNLKGVIYGSHAAMQIFQTQRRGVLLNMGSIDSETPLAYQGSYSATKAAVLSLGRVLNEETRLSGLRDVRVVTVMPWAVDTPWWMHAANYSGGTPRMALPDDPWKIVRAVIRASLDPAEEVVVGWKAKGSYVSHRLFSDLTERISGNVAHHYQIETAPPAPPTKGSLFEPMEEGREVEGGLRERMEREEKEQEAKPPKE